MFCKKVSVLVGKHFLLKVRHKGKMNHCPLEIDMHYFIQMECLVHVITDRVVTETSC